MENSIKLYKCYKGTCSKCLNEENPYITEDEYIELLDADGKLQCPEGHLDCGIKELRPEDYPKQPKDKKKIFLIGGGILILLLILGGVFAYINFQKNKVKNAVEIGQAIVDGGKEVGDILNEKVTNLVKEADLFFENKDYENAKNAFNAILVLDPNNLHAKQVLLEIDKISLPAVKEEKVEEKDKGEDIADPPRKKANTTVKLDYGYYEGPTINDLPNGQGIMYFNERHIINPKDPQKRYAEAGEYVTGVFHNGYLVNGKLFGKDKQQKEALFIGQ